MKFVLKVASILVFAASYSQSNKSINDSLINSASALNAEGKFQESIAILDKISKYSPENNKALLEKSRALYYDKKYDDAIDLLLKVDKKSLLDEELHSYYLILGNVYDEADKKDKSIELYTEAIQKFPESYLLYYNRGITNSRNKNKEAAYKDLTKSIEIYPNFYRSHYALGALVFANGNLTEGLLAITTSILLDFNGKITASTIKSLNFDLSKKYEENSDRFIIEGHEAYESIDNIIKKQFALNTNYKLQSDFDIVYVRQLQAVLSELSKIKEKKGFIAERYLDFYNRIWQSKKFEVFSYRLFQNHDSEAIQKLLAKKNGEITKFNEWLFINLTQTISTRKVNFFDKEQIVSVVDEDGYIGYGNLVDNKKEGLWRYNYPTGSKFLEGNLKAGNLDGEMSVYYQNGKKTKTSNYKDFKLNGKATFYYLNGNLLSEREFLNDNENGKQTFYFRFGGRKSYYSITTNKIQGKEEFFYENGKLKSTWNYENGEGYGPYNEYFVDGKLENSSNYEKGKLQGDKISYFENGNVSSKESYHNGNVVGNYDKYYPNGDLYNSYKTDNGNVTYYKEMVGKNLSEEQFYEGGRLSREKYYLNNIPLIEYSFVGKDSNEHLSGYKLFDAKGNLLKEEKIKPNTPFVVKLANNTIFLEGAYNAKGQKQGEWKYYNAVTGLLESHSYYDKDVQTNKYEEFYPNGKLKTSYEIKDGKKDGVYLSYYRNGSKSSETYYVNGIQNGESKDFYTNGKLKDISYVSNDLLDGILERFTFEGELYERSFYTKNDVTQTDYYDKGRLVSSIDYGKNGPIKFYKKNGLEFSTSAIKNGVLEGNYLVKDNKNQKIFEVTLMNGEKYGEGVSYNPNGSVFIKANYLNNKMYGEYIKNNLDGKLYMKMNYLNDSEYGISERYFHEGFKMISTEYTNDDKNGKEIFYGSNGEVLLTLTFAEDNLISYQRSNEAETPVVKATAQIIANYKNGKPGIEVNYKNGEMHGVYKYYSENGTNLITSEYTEGLIQKRQFNYITGKPYLIENFKEGDYSGKVIYYHPNGQTKIETEYANDELDGSYKEYNPEGKLIIEKKYEDDILVENK